MEFTSVSIGPVKFNREKQEVTLEPGLYKLSSRIVFGVVADTVIKNVEYDGLSPDVDPNSAVCNRIAGHIQTPNVGTGRIGAEEYAVR